MNKVIRIKDDFRDEWVEVRAESSDAALDKYIAEAEADPEAYGQGEPGANPRICVMAYDPDDKRDWQTGLIVFPVKDGFAASEEEIDELFEKHDMVELSWKVNSIMGKFHSIAQSDGLHLVDRTEDIRKMFPKPFAVRYEETMSMTKGYVEIFGDQDPHVKEMKELQAA